MPVESAISTRRFVRLATKMGMARIGFDEMLSSSKLTHASSESGRAPRKLHEISSARSELDIIGRVWLRKAGMALGVLLEPTRRCVVPGR